MQQLFYCILYCFILLFSKPLVKMMFHQCSIQNKGNTREALLKKIANTDSLFSTAMCTQWIQPICFSYQYHFLPHDKQCQK